MSVANTIPARQAFEAYAAAAKAKPGSREAKARNAAQGFEATFLQNMLENMVSSLGEEGPSAAARPAAAHGAASSPTRWPVRWRRPRASASPPRSIVK